MSDIINMTNLTFSYEGRQGRSVLQIPSFNVAKGQNVFLYGPSGSGKTTLLNLLTGLLLPTSGTLTVLGQDWANISGRKRDAFRANHIGFVFQQLNLIPYLTVEQNILLGGYFGDGKPRLDQQKSQQQQVADLLNALNLSVDLMTTPAVKLSVGQQQRVAIARALINKPEILIADEPTSALDEESRDAFMTLLFKVTEQYQSTLVFVSHDKTLRKHFTKSVNITDINKASKGESGVC